MQDMGYEKSLFDNSYYKSRKRLMCRLSWFSQYNVGRSPENTGGTDISCDIEACAENVGHAGIFDTSSHDVL